MCPHFHLFGLSLPTFGACMLVGMIAAFVLLYFNRKRVPFSEDDLLTMAIYAILGGFLGAKLLYWIVELDQILADPHFLLETLTSGFVFYGALILGVAAIWLFTRKRKQPFLAYIDLVMPSFILAQGFGRIGCFCAGCCYGAPSDCALAVVYPAGSSAPAGIPLLPTQLFESAFCILFAAVLVFLFRKQKRNGKTSAWYLIGYGVWRFIIEFFRSDDRGTVGALSTSQFISIFTVLAGIVLLVLVLRGKTPAHTVEAAAPAQEAENTKKAEQTEPSPEAEQSEDFPEAEPAEKKNEAETEEPSEESAEGENEAKPAEPSEYADKE